VRHEFKVSKAHENWRAVLEGNAYNLLNQHSAVGYYEFAIPTNLISPSRVAGNALAPRFPGDPSTDWGKVMNGYNYVDALNGAGAFAGTYQNSKGQTVPVQPALTLANRLGMPQIFQTARQFRLAARFVF
jgi:hypothetical protein